MWLVVGGRQTEAIIGAINEYHDYHVEGKEYVEDILNGDKKEEVRCVVLIDSGIGTEEEIEKVIEIGKVYRDSKVLYYTRGEDTIPEEVKREYNLDVYVSKERISVSDLAKMVGDYR